MRTTVKQVITSTLALLVSQGALAVTIPLDAFTDMTRDPLGDQGNSFGEIWSANDMTDWAVSGSPSSATNNSVLIYTHSGDDFRLTGISITGVARRNRTESTNLPGDLHISVFDGNAGNVAFTQVCNDCGPPPPFGTGRGDFWEQPDYTRPFTDVPLNIGALANVLFSAKDTIRFQMYDHDSETEFPDNIYNSLTITLEGIYVGGGNGDVPEPASIALMGAGLVGLGLGRRRKSRS